MITMTFSVGEIRLLIDALTRAASRQDAEARYRPRSAGPHDRTAREMRRLLERILETRRGAAQWDKAIAELKRAKLV